MCNIFITFIVLMFTFFFKALFCDLYHETWRHNLHCYFPHSIENFSIDM